MKVEKFEDIIAWQKGIKLSIKVYREFSSIKDYGFKDQIQRASVSISNNIAEGFERKGNKEFGRFLYISKGSCGEVRSMLYLAKEFRYLSDELFKELYDDATEISKIISGIVRGMKY